MKPPRPPAKRRIHSFEPDADLCLQLDAVIARGYKLGFIINAALRRHLPEVVGKRPRLEPLPGALAAKPSASR